MRELYFDKENIRFPGAEARDAKKGFEAGAIGDVLIVGDDGEPEGDPPLEEGPPTASGGNVGDAGGDQDGEAPPLGVDGQFPAADPPEGIPVLPPFDDPVPDPAPGGNVGEPGGSATVKVRPWLPSVVVDPPSRDYGS